MHNNYSHEKNDISKVQIDELLKNIPVDEVDIKRLLQKYTSLLVEVFGMDEAKARLEDILTEPQKEQLTAESPLPRRMVLLNTNTGFVEVGMSNEWGHLADLPHYMDITGRLSDIYVYRSVNPDDPHKLRCKVDGVQQMSVMLSPAQDRYWQGARLHDMCDFARYKLAGEIFADLLLGRNQQNERSPSMKR